MQFYDIDGLETDVQDPKFFIDEEHYHEVQEAIQEMIYEYL